jgi:hypothetical protein
MPRSPIGMVGVGTLPAAAPGTGIPPNPTPVITPCPPCTGIPFTDIPCPLCAPAMFGRNLQCRLVRGVDTREEWHWSHAWQRFKRCKGVKLNGILECKCLSRRAIVPWGKPAGTRTWNCCPFGAVTVRTCVGVGVMVGVVVRFWVKVKVRLR